MAGRSPSDLPASSTPDAVAEKKDQNGKVIQRRSYGPDGLAITNIDYGHDHTGVGDPHAHDWDWAKKPPRQPSRSLNPGE